MLIPELFDFAWLPLVSFDSQPRYQASSAGESSPAPAPGSHVLPGTVRCGGGTQGEYPPANNCGLYVFTLHGSDCTAVPSRALSQTAQLQRRARPVAQLR